MFMYLSKSNPLATLVYHLTEFVVMDARDLETLHRHSGISFPGSPRLQTSSPDNGPLTRKIWLTPFSTAFKNSRPSSKGKSLTPWKMTCGCKPTLWHVTRNQFTNLLEQKHYDTESSLSKNLQEWLLFRFNHNHRTVTATRLPLQVKCQVILGLSHYLRG